MNKSHLTFIALAILTCGCNNPNTNQEEEISASLNAESDSVITTKESGEVTTETFVTDWEKQNLIGQIASLSEHSFDVDENGEEIGMGGSSHWYDFDSTGRIIEEGSNGCCGAEFRTIIYKYNEENQLTHRIIYATDDWSEDITKDADYSEKEKFFYKEGVLVKIKKAGFDQELTQEVEFEFNGDELIKEEVFNEGSDQKEIITYTSSPSKCVETHYLSDTIFYYKIENDLDQIGNITETRKYFDDGKIQEERFEYEYDEKGNWIEQRRNYRYILEDDTKEEWRKGNTTTRSIKYY